MKILFPTMDSARYPRIFKKQRVKLWGFRGLYTQISIFFLKELTYDSLWVQIEHEYDQLQSLNGQGNQTLMHNKLLIRILATSQRQLFFPRQKWFCEATIYHRLYVYIIYHIYLQVDCHIEGADWIHARLVIQRAPHFCFYKPNCIENIN